MQTLVWQDDKIHLNSPRTLAWARSKRQDTQLGKEGESQGREKKEEGQWLRAGPKLRQAAHNLRCYQ